MEAVWTRAPGWVHRVVPDKVLLAAAGGQERELGGMAAAVWVVLDVAATRSEIARRLGQAGDEIEAPSGAIDDALDHLIAAKLVQAAGLADLDRST